MPRNANQCHQLVAQSVTHDVVQVVFLLSVCGMIHGATDWVNDLSLDWPLPYFACSCLPKKCAVTSQLKKNATTTSTRTTTGAATITTSNNNKYYHRFIEMLRSN